MDPLQPGGGGVADLAIQHHVGIGVGQGRQRLRRRIEGRDDMHIDPDRPQELPDLAHIIAATETERGGPEEVHARAATAAFRTRTYRRSHQRARQMIEGLRGPPVLLLGVGGELQRDHRDRELHPHRERPRLILDQLGGTGFADEERAGFEALVRLPHRRHHEICGVPTQVSGLEGGVGHRRPRRPALDHREEEIGVGVALRGV